jgi:predicted RecB family nuclease
VQERVATQLDWYFRWIFFRRVECYAEFQMRLIAPDFITHERPTPCELRVWLKHRGEPEREASVYDEVLHRLGERHEQQHLASLGTFLDLSQLDEEQRLRRTSEAIADRVSVLYQPAFRVKHMFGATEAEIFGIPDFLIHDGDGYIIRDAKMARRIDEKNHPEILLQVQLYGWLFEKSYGAPTRALQVLSGMKEILPIPYDGGVSALAALERLLAIKQRA